MNDESPPESCGELHGFFGPKWWWDDTAEEWVCVRCLRDDRMLEEAGL